MRLCTRCHEAPADEGYEHCESCDHQLELAAANEILEREAQERHLHFMTVLVDIVRTAGGRRDYP